MRSKILSPFQIQLEMKEECNPKDIQQNSKAIRSNNHHNILTITVISKIPPSHYHFFSFFRILSLDIRFYILPKLIFKWQDFDSARTWNSLYHKHGAINGNQNNDFEFQKRLFLSWVLKYSVKKYAIFLKKNLHQSIFKLEFCSVEKLFIQNM